MDRQNRRYHDRVAARYDSVYDNAYWRFYRDVSWRHLKGYLPPQRPALAADLGCGTGWFGRKLLKAGFGVVFLDPSGAMLEAARKAVDEEGDRGLETRFVQTDLEHLQELGAESLAFATAQGDPLSFCADPLAALRQLHRILAPGAHLVLSVDNRIAGVRSLLAERSPAPALELLRTGRTAWRAHRPEEAFPMKMFDPDELDHLLAKSGFEPLSRIGKTCLVQRENAAWLDDGDQRLRLLEAEERLHGSPHWLGMASHMQVAARRR
jgi:SAM-dependent methyltransferase